MLFLILIAVALFAALSYAITSSSRSGSAAPSEKDKLDASALMQYGLALETGIQLMRSRGIDVSRLDFESANRLSYSGAVSLRDNTLCSIADCKVLDIGGGAVPYVAFEKMGASPNPYGGTNDKPGHWSVRLVSIVNLGSSYPDVTLVVAGLNFNVCEQVNSMAGVSSTAVQNFTGEVNYIFQGDVSTALVANDARTLGDDLPSEQDYIGKKSFCLKTPASGYADFYYVLIER